MTVRIVHQARTINKVARF